MINHGQQIALLKATYYAKTAFLHVDLFNSTKCYDHGVFSDVISRLFFWESQTTTSIKSKIKTFENQIYF